MVCHWDLSDSNSPQVFWTLLSILTDLNNAVVRMVSTRPFIFKSSRPHTNPLMTVSSAPITIGSTVTLMFHSFFFSSLARSSYLSLFSLSFTFTQWSAETAESTIRQVSFFLFFFLTITMSNRLAEIRCSICISKSQRSLCVSFSRTDSVLCIYHLFVWSNQILDHLPYLVQSSLILFLR